MNDLIEKEDAIDEIRKESQELHSMNVIPLATVGAMVDAIVRVPVVEPKQGEWIDKGWHGDWQFETDGRGNCWHEYECSECGFHKKGSKSNYCPDCGTRMSK